MKQLTDQNFDTHINNSAAVVIDFMAEWCVPCKMIGVALNAISDEYEDQALVAKVDVDANPELVAKYGIRSMPTVLFLKNGEVVDKQVGLTTKQALEQKLQATL